MPRRHGADGALCHGGEGLERTPLGLYALALWHCRRYVDAVIVNSVAMEKADPERDGWIFGNMELFREKAREVL